MCSGDSKVRQFFVGFCSLLLPRKIHVLQNYVERYLTCPKINFILRKITYTLQTMLNPILSSENHRLYKLIVILIENLKATKNKKKYQN